MKYLRILFSAAALLLAASCIENDIPYPTIELNIRSIEGKGFTVAGISLVNRTVTLTLDEKTDIRKVTIDKAEFDVATSNPMMTDKEKFISQIRTSQPLSGEFDLRAPLYVTLSLYQDYEWTIVAEQPIARSFTVAGQIGSTLIDTQARTATAYVAEGTDLKAVTVTSLKLGPADITAYSPTAEELSATGFETVRLVDVTCHGRTERWMLHVQPTNVKIGVRDIDLWNNTGRRHHDGNAGRLCDRRNPVPSEGYRRLADDAEGRTGRKRHLYEHDRTRMDKPHQRCGHPRKTPRHDQGRLRRANV